MRVSDIVRDLSRLTGFSQPILRRFEAVTRDRAELIAAIGQHCNPDNQGSCPCPVCGGGAKLTLRHDGTSIEPEKLARFDTKPVSRRMARQLLVLGPAVQAYTDRSMEEEG
jgi:hypothetical protein